MNKKILLYLALMVLGLYMIPQTVALFAGQHSYYGSAGIACDTCHSDVASQLTLGNSYGKHKAAAGNYNYTTYLSLGGKAYNGTVITDYNNNNWTWNSAQRAWQFGSQFRNVSLDRNGNGIDGDEICMLCHNATLAGLETHVAVVRVCDDDRCHGNRNYSYNSPQFFNKNTQNTTAAGYYLSRADVHELFYLDASNQSSSYGAAQAFGQTPGNVYGSFISRGHWACEGCHTEAAVNVTIVEAPVYNHSEGTPSAPKRYN